MSENFSDKYTKTNFITRLLIDNFYGTAADLAKGTQADKVLEVGCGPGFSTAYLSKIFQGKNFTASEYDKDLVAEARRRNAGISIAQESVYDLKREDGSFDLVILLEVLEHLEDPESALKEIWRVLRTGGKCILSVPREPLWRSLNMMRGKYWKNLGNTPGHINHWSTRMFTDLVAKYFRVTKVSAPLPWTIVLAEKVPIK